MGNYIFWTMMLFFMLLVPATMIFFGVKFQKSAPKNINWAYGYRSERSTKNRDTWVFAHKQIGSLWKSWGIALVPVSVIPMLFVFGADVERIGNLCIVLMVVQLVVMITPIFIVESRLKKTFDKYGRRKIGF